MNWVAHRTVLTGLAMLALALLLLACGGGQEEVPTGRASPATVPTVAATPAGTAFEGSPTPGAPISVATGQPQPPMPAPSGHNVMAVDVDPSDEPVTGSRALAVGATFDVSINLVASEDPYDTYQFRLEWDPDVLALVGGTHLEPDQLTACSGFTPMDSNTVTTYCTRIGPPRTFAGRVDVMAFRCVDSGSSAIRLQSIEEDAIFGSILITGGVPVSVELVDARVTCQ